MKEKLKNNIEKGKAWLKKHNKLVIGTFAGIGLAVTGYAITKKVKNNNYECDDNYDFEPGRDCKMRFIVDDDSNEVLGEVPCTESYAKDMIDIYSNEMLIEDKEA